ncbi:5'-3' exoribonuclease 3 [Zea mays]|uniref:5'-3' exoribonuclease 3 n=1 Tax=Zea mays TaxID=4577 RepID=A0A1D6FJM4_MAIZE|nr:5'-3' exoribonuclease 3 [Zea mays]AQK91960.1 5'-3' exoribonuclease 3 [Zea mays]
MPPGHPAEIASFLPRTATSASKAVAVSASSLVPAPARSRRCRLRLLPLPTTRRIPPSPSFWDSILLSIS